MKRDGSKEEAGLVKRARGGDSNAFGQLVVRYAAAVSALVYQHVADPEATRDISQTAFLKAWRGIGSVQAAASFRAWLFRIARNESVEFIRRNRAQRRAPSRIDRRAIQDVVAEEEPPLERLIDDEERASVIAALFELPPRQRSVFVLRHFHGLSNPEIAQMLSCSTNTVKVNLNYALKSLREKLAGGANHDEDGV